MRNAVRFTGFILVVLLSLAPISRAQENSDGEKDREKDGGKKHYLTFQVSYFGSAHRSHEDDFSRSETSIEVNDRFSGRIEMRPTQAYDLPTSVAAQTARMQAIQAAMAAGDVKAIKAATPPLLVTWYPVGSEVEITGAILEKKRTSSSNIEFGESRAQSDAATESYSGQKVFMANFGNAFVKIRAEEKVYDLQFSIMPDMAATWEAVHQILVSDHKEVGHDRHSGSEAEVPLDMGPNQLGLGYSNYQIAAEVKRQPLGSDAGELTGTTRIPVPKPEGWDGEWTIGMLVSWNLEISPSPYRLEIEVNQADYAKWRPTTATPEADPGDPLNVTARVVAIDGSKVLVKVAQFEWTLQGTSKEPGVALNYPVNATDQRFDLELAADGGGFVLVDANQRVVRSEPEGVADKVQVVPFDWGGWSTLQVTAVLEGGRRLTGRLKGEFDAGLRVPKRTPDSHIADGWKEKNKSGADDLDDDNEPVGDGTKGDGLTLYEEYRGFYVAGKRVEGAPKTKDYFVDISRAGFALPGVERFRRNTRLAVHQGLSETDLSPTRVINANHKLGAHKVDQHVIVVRVGSEADFSLTVGGPGNPKMISSVDLIANAGSDAVSSSEIKTRNIDSTVAHELGHTVNIWHHGETDPGFVRWTVRNGSLYEGAEKIEVQNPAGDVLTDAIIAIVNGRQRGYLQGWRVAPPEQSGQHSGNDSCVMRYWCAQAYEIMPGWRMTDFDEPIGSLLCSSPQGTGINDPNGECRHGNAAKNRGACSKQILVNDDADAPTR